MTTVKITYRPFIIDPFAEFNIGDRDYEEILLDPRIQDTQLVGGELDLSDYSGESQSVRAEVEEDLWRYVMETA